MSDALPEGSTTRGSETAEVPAQTRYGLLSRLRTCLPWGPLLEILLIAICACLVGRRFLNPDPAVWPAGLEFGWGVHAQNVWQLLPECGACVLWNGSVNGGSPTFAELHAAVLHPLVALTTLVWGAVTSAKLTVVSSLIVAGVAQWWLAGLLRLGRVPRLWSAAMAVVGGHLAGRMQYGLVPLVLSIAFGSLVIPATLHLALTRKPGAVVGLGVAFALLLLSGQGYAQLGTLMAILPASAVFLLGRGMEAKTLRRQFILAMTLAGLLSAVMWVPLLRFWPHFAKWRSPSFEGVQTIGNTLLNLVISDPEFFHSPVLGKFPYPFINVNYIGWVPVILAMFGLRLIPHKRSRLLAFLALAFGLLFVTSAGGPLRALARLNHGLATFVRHPNFFACLAVPLLLAVAAWGLDELLQRNWPRLRLARLDWSVGSVGLSINTAWLTLALPLLLSVRSAYDFGQVWMGTMPRPFSEQAVVDALTTEDAQWVAPPFGVQLWVQLTAERGLKATNINRPWFWEDRYPPPPYREGISDRVDLSVPAYVETIEHVHIFEHPENVYACVQAGDDCAPCRATAKGGDIDVECETPVAGMLVVHENMYPGWRASRDGEPAQLGDGQWLTVSAPAGQHSYQFRYRPWDATLGILLTMTGLVVAVWLWRRPPALARTAAAQAFE